MGPMLHGLTTDIHPRHADSRGTTTREFIMSDIIWPEGFVPGFTDNFCSNEVIVEGVSAADIWPLLVIPSWWAPSAKEMSLGGLRIPAPPTCFSAPVRPGLKRPN